MKILKWLDKNLEESILVILLIIMSLIMVLQIISRYVMQNSLVWSEELTRFLFVWSAFIGMAYTTKEGTLINITNFKDMLPEKLKSGIDLLIKVILLIFFGILIVKGWEVVSITRETGQKSAAMEIPMWTVHISIVVGAVLSFFRTIQDLIRMYITERKEVA